MRYFEYPKPRIYAELAEPGQPRMVIQAEAFRVDDQGRKEELIYMGPPRNSRHKEYGLGPHDQDD